MGDERPADRRKDDKDAIQKQSNKWFNNPDKLRPDGYDESLLDECRQETCPPSRRNLYS